eukprot:Nk52_evm4s353 gene=Nk52_evmTU4s353
MGDEKEPKEAWTTKNAIELVDVDEGGGSETPNAAAGSQDSVGEKGHPQPRSSITTNSSSGKIFSFSNESPSFDSDFMGPVLEQTGFMFIWFIFIWVSGKITGWTPNVRTELIYPYIYLANCIWQIDRLVFGVCKMTHIPMYLTLIPYAYLAITSREQYQLVSSLWFISAVTIHMQCSTKKLRQHLLLFTFLFLISYILVVVSMFYLYTDNSHYYRMELIRPIDAGKEGTFVVGIALLGIAFFFLERFLQKFLTKLIEYERNAATLQTANADLQRQIKKASTKAPESPMAKVIGCLRDVQMASYATTELNQALDFAIGVLSGAESLNQAELNLTENDNADSELIAWVHTMLSHGAAVVGKEEAFSSVEVITPLVEDDDEENSKVQTVHEKSFSQALEKQVVGVLKDIDSWDFSVFDCAAATNGRPLFFVARAIFRKRNFISTFNLDENKLNRFLLAIEAGYVPTNPYHNSVHAADVTHSMHVLLNSKNVGEYLSIQDQFACIVACLFHDYEHPGKNNQFLIKNRSELAIRYNDRSVLENHHASASFTLLAVDDSINIFKHMPAKQYREFRELVLSLVIVTDMTMHYETIGKFKNKLNIGFDQGNPSDMVLLMSICIKASDISNPAKKWDLCEQWANLIMEEFFRQGDAEKLLNRPVSLMMNREDTDIAKCQVGFIDFVITPMFEIFGTYLHGKKEDSFLCNNIMENKLKWEQIAAESASTAAENSQKEQAKEVVNTNLTKGPLLEESPGEVKTELDAGTMDPPTESTDNTEIVLEEV